MQYQIRPMSLGEILDTGFSIVRNHFVQIVGISALVYVPIALVQGMFGDVKPGAPPTAAMGIGIAVGFIAFAILSPIVTVAITYLIGELYQGRSATIGESLRQSLAIVLPVLGTGLLSGLLIAGGFLLLVIPGIWLLLGMIVLSQVMIFERRFGTSAIRRSLELMRGNRLRALGIMVLGGIVTGVLGFAFGLFANFVPFLGPIASGIASSVGNAFIAAVSVVLYFDIRCRKEAFEIEHLARLVRAGAAPPPQPAR
jgi:hypothetical protein